MNQKIIMGDHSKLTNEPLNTFDFLPRDHSLRRPLGGRLRIFYLPKSTRKNSKTTRLDAIRKAIARGELTPNSFNRWNLIKVNNHIFGWTFVDPESINEQVQIEATLARKESGEIVIVKANENSAIDAIHQISNGVKKPDLLIISRNLHKHKKPNEHIEELINFARYRGIVIHMIIAGLQSVDIQNGGSVERDELFDLAYKRFLFENLPLSHLLPAQSKIEKYFGHQLENAGLKPKPQMPIAKYFLDFAVILNEHDKQPLRLDVEVDGKYWHEELPGQRKPSDNRRDVIMQRLGWKPLRFWDYEIEEDSDQCIEKILNVIEDYKKST